MNSIKKFLPIFVVLVCALFIAQNAQALDSPFVIDNVPNVIGVGVGMYPDYLGSDHYKVGAAPFFRWTFAGQERYIQLLVTELSFNVLNHPNFGLGPVLNYRFGRDDDVHDDVVKKMKEIDDTVEAGIFASYTWKEKRNPRHRLITSVEFLADVGGKYDGWLAMASARYWYPVIEPLDLLIGIGATYGNSDYMNKYFGVSTTDAARTGLPFFKADGGLRDLNAQFAVVFHLSQSWHLGAGVKYFDLENDAAASPIVDQRGSSNQWVYGIGVAYSW